MKKTKEKNGAENPWLDRRKDGPSGAFKGNEDRSWIPVKEWLDD
jgi:hypothetical protein